MVSATPVLEEYAKQVTGILNKGCQVAIVIGGGNIFRGISGTEAGFDRLKGDQMGMLATVINSLALENMIKRIGGTAKVFTSIRMEPVGELYNRDRVLEALENKTVCILSGGTGNPFFTTDTAAALRAAEPALMSCLKERGLTEFILPTRKKIPPPPNMTHLLSKRQ